MEHRLQSASRPARNRIDYGVDAPGIVRMFFAVAVALLAASCSFLLWPAIPRWLAALAAILAFFPLTLGTMMVLYAVWGKRRTRDFLLSQVPWHGGEAVLDVGCGRCLLAAGAAKRLSTGSVTGIDVWSTVDLSNNSLAAARAVLDQEGVAAKVHLLTMDASEMTLPGDSFDVVLSLLCLHNIEPADRQQRALDHIARVLKPGGIAVLADYLPTHGYAAALARHGFEILATRPRFGVALSLMWVTTARKPLPHSA